MINIEESGLNMRETPDTKGKIIILIPFNSKVEIIERENGVSYNINGRSGSWTNVKYKNKTGWVFGGFLRQYLNLTVKNENDLIGKSIMWLGQYSGDTPEESAYATAGTVTITFCERNRLVGKCNIDGYGSGSVTGEWDLVNAKDKSFSVKISGEVNSIIYQEKEIINKGSFNKKIIKISDTIGLIDIPLCNIYGKKSIIYLTNKIVTGSECDK
jgi:hypothetical protein